MTEYLRLGEEWRRAERLASVDTLGGTVSHEIRNALGALCLHVDLLEDVLDQEYASPRSQTHAVLAEIKTGLTRLQEIVHDSLALVRLQHLQREPVDLGTFLATVLQEFQGSCAAHGIIVRSQGSPCLERRSCTGQPSDVRL
jgi:signal transduction histidine kinase